MDSKWEFLAAFLFIDEVSVYILQINTRKKIHWYQFSLCYSPELIIRQLIDYMQKLPHAQRYRVSFQ